MIGSKKKKKFIGSFDGFNAGVVRGWVKSSSNNKERLVVEVSSDGHLLKSIVADMFREDLKKSGIGDGCYAFEAHLGKEALAYLECKDRTKLQFTVSGLGLLDEVEVRFGRKYEMTQRELAALKLDFDQFNYLSNEAPSSEFCPGLISLDDEMLATEKQDITNSCFEGFFPETPGMSPVSSVFSPKPNVSPYVIFLRDRMKHDNHFLVETNPNDIDGLLFWYLETYGSLRKPRRVPLSADEVSYLNDLVGISGCPLKLTRYHMMHLMRTEKEFDYKGVLSDLQRYRAIVYEWITGYCSHFNLEDCLVPEHYVDVMRTVLPEHRTEKYPFNYFVQLYFNRLVDLHESDANTSEGRRVVYLRLVLRFINKPRLFCLIPDVVIDELLKQGVVNEITQCASEVLGPSYLTDGFKKSLSYQGFKQTMLAQGFNLPGRFYTTFDSRGNRMDALKFKRICSDGDKEFDVQVIGPFEKASGLGQAARMAADILERSGLNVNRVDFGLDNPAPEGFSSEQKHGKLSTAKINLIHLNAESYPLALAYLPDVFTGSYNVGYFYWELNSPAKCHELGMDLVDEVWVATDYGVNQYSPYMPRKQPVTNVGMAVEDFFVPERNESRNYLEQNFGIKSNTTVYLAAFDSFSFVQRKNPHAVVKAFLDAFKSNEPVHLILKTQNRDFVGDPNQLRIWDEVIRLTGQDDRVTIVNKTLKYTDLLKLKRGCDCYVTLHRSEGWGFGMIEAMSLGLPVIATGYSGNLEFCKPDNSWLVDYEENYLGPEDYIFVIPGQKWANPKHESAVLAMKEAYEFPEIRQLKADTAQEFVKQNFSMDAIAKRYRTRVDDIINSL